MSEPKEEQPNQIVEGASLDPLGYFLGLQFHPTIKLDKRKGLEFAAKMADYLDPQGMKMEAHRWMFSQQLGGTPKGKLHVVIQSSQLEVQAAFPTLPQEWFESRYGAILETFVKVFEPTILMGSSAMITGTLQIDGDARAFLAERLMGFQPEKLAALDRPIHLFGVRLFSPQFAFKKTGKKGKALSVDWQVEIKAESLMDDPTKLFVQADADWPIPREWNKKASEDVIGRLAVVSDYIQKKIVPFLRQT